MTSVCALESQSHVKIANNGYQLLVVAVHDSVPDNHALFEKIKVRTMDKRIISSSQFDVSNVLLNERYR